MELKIAFASTLRDIRLEKGLTQEDFVLVSSRTNISLLERAGTVPTIEKLDAICTRLQVHPVAFLAACYMRKEGADDVPAFLNLIQNQLLSFPLLLDSKTPKA